MNNLAKHLDESKDQAFPVNRTILVFLDKIAALVDPGIPVTDQQVLKIATQANNIRGKFLDMTKNLKDAIPELLLKQGDYKIDEVPPLGVKK